MAAYTMPPANGDWLELLFPIVLMVVYGAATVGKAFMARAKQKDQQAETTSGAAMSERSKPQYKPLDEAVRPRQQAPPQRTLPYARTASRTSGPPAEPSYADQAARRRADQERQQQIEQRRLRQIEALRRQQLQRKQYMQRQQQIQQQALQSVKAAQTVGQRLLRSPGSVSKTPQEALRQARTGKPVGAAAARPAAGKEPPRVRPEIRQEPIEAGGSTEAELRRMLRKRGSLRTAFVLKEILDLPMALRDG
ncbi:MAG TPA: hypothetical protein ENN97_04500 [Phycisphaerales bacterium]|nr:hypothetical protein [Phycisphaerales bacterium]